MPNTVFELQQHAILTGDTYTECLGYRALHCGCNRSLAIVLTILGEF